MHPTGPWVVWCPSTEDMGNFLSQEDAIVYVNEQLDRVALEDRLSYFILRLTRSYSGRADS